MCGCGPGGAARMWQGPEGLEHDGGGQEGSEKELEKHQRTAAARNQPTTGQDVNE